MKDKPVTGPGRRTTPAIRLDQGGYPPDAISGGSGPRRRLRAGQRSPPLIGHSPFRKDATQIHAGARQAVRMPGRSTTALSNQTSQARMGPPRLAQILMTSTSGMRS
jgi:hypothetical protein